MVENNCGQFYGESIGIFDIILVFFFHGKNDIVIGNLS